MDMNIYDRVLKVEASESQTHTLLTQMLYDRSAGRRTFRKLTSVILAPWASSTAGLLNDGLKRHGPYVPLNHEAAR